MQKKKSVFLEFMGYTPTNKMLDFFAGFQEFDYNKTFIAKEAGMAYVTVKKLIPVFVKRGFIKTTRKIGKAKLYKTNMKNASMKAFHEFWAGLAMVAMEEEAKSVIKVKNR